ncbi:MAG: DASH complex subunit SPC19 [Pirellulaceae bacterium]|nr:DASH complex subunit SPC19 [Pirellulaceae bacterium]
MKYPGRSTIILACSLAMTFCVYSLNAEDDGQIPQLNAEAPEPPTEPDFDLPDEADTTDKNEDLVPERRRRPPRRIRERRDNRREGPNTFLPHASPHEPSHGDPELGRREHGPDHHQGHMKEHRRGGRRGPHPNREHVRLDPEWRELIERDQQLERETREMASRLRHGRIENGEEIEEAKHHIAELVEEHFDVRQSRRELELEKLRERLERLEHSIERRHNAREEIISRRVAELTGEEHDLSF